jgi:hypothetical protein
MPARTEHAAQLGRSCLRGGEEIERLSTEAKVEALVWEGQELVGDDIGATERVVDVETHVVRPGWEQRLVRLCPAEDVQNVAGRKVCKGVAEIVAQTAQVEIEVVGAARM